MKYQMLEAHKHFDDDDDNDRDTGDEKQEKKVVY